MMDGIFEFDTPSGHPQTVLLKDVKGISKIGSLVYVNVETFANVKETFESSEGYYHLRDRLAEALNPGKDTYYVVEIEGQTHYIKPEIVTGMVERFYHGNKQAIITTKERVYYFDGSVRDFLMSKTRLK